MSPSSLSLFSWQPLPAVVRDSEGVHRLNYARLVISYTRRFSQTDPREALQYFFLLKVSHWSPRAAPTAGVWSAQGLEGREGQDVFSLCVAELVMESREFALVLGQQLADGSRRPGAVDKFLRDSSELTAFVAAQAEAQGLYEDAVRLYDLCKVGGSIWSELRRRCCYRTTRKC